MNANQKAVLMFTALFVLVMILYPPWFDSQGDIRYCPMWEKRAAIYDVDFLLLMIEIIIACAIGGGLFAALGKHRKE